MSVVIVNTSAGLQSALSTAVSGEIIELATGTYSNVSVNSVNPSGTVTIQSQNSAHPAVITNMSINSSSHLTFNHLTVDASTLAPISPTPGNTWALNVMNSDHINFTYITAHGAAGVTLSNAVSALNFEHSTNVSVGHSTFQDFHYGVQDYEDNGFNASYNSFNRIFDDGIRGGGTSNVVVENNSFTNFHMDPSDPDHPDTIQFWTAGETATASNFYIANNTYTRGSGAAVQGIFFRDEVGNLPFQNVSIVNNNYAGSLYRGISVWDGRSVTIRGNTLTSYSDTWTGLVFQDVTGGSSQNNYSNNFQYINDLYMTISGNTTTAAVPVPAALEMLPISLSRSSDFSQLPVGQPIAAPEPTAWILLVVGFAAMGVAIRRRRESRRTA